MNAYSFSKVDQAPIGHTGDPIIDSIQNRVESLQHLQGIIDKAADEHHEACQKAYSVPAMLTMISGKESAVLAHELVQLCLQCDSSIFDGEQRKTLEAKYFEFIEISKAHFESTFLLN